MKFGIDRLLAEPELRKPLHGKRVALQVCVCACVCACVCVRMHVCL